MEKAKDFYSKNVADAIRQACAEFATSQEKLDIEVVETGSAGIFGLCRKRAHIRVTLKKGVADAEPGEKKKGRSKVAESAAEEKTVATGDADKTEAPQEKKQPGKAGGKGRGKQRGRKTDMAAQQAEPFEPPSEEVLASISSELDNMLQLMGFPSEVNVTFNDNAIQCQINGEHEESITGSDGRTLDSMQYLVRKMFSRELPDRMMIDLNAGDFRQRRVIELQKAAAELAEKVKDDGKTQAIPALNPSERRVVHVALQDDKGVRSRSVGDGLFKKVLIYKPGSKAKRSGGRRRGRQGGGSADK